MEDIPEDLIINWDHTGLPVSNWTMAEEGSKRVEIVGLDDKRQKMAVFGCSMGGDLKSYTVEILQDVCRQFAYTYNLHGKSLGE